MLQGQMSRGTDVWRYSIHGYHPRSAFRLKQFPHHLEQQRQFLFSAHFILWFNIRHDQAFDLALSLEHHLSHDVSQSSHA